MVQCSTSLLNKEITQAPKLHAANSYSHTQTEVHIKCLNKARIVLGLV